MDCLEARRNFELFWRKILGFSDRRAFLAHLEGCGRCDRSFRVFALTAPVLHSERPRRTRAFTIPTAAVTHAAPVPQMTSRQWESFGIASAIAAMVAATLYVVSPRFMHRFSHTAPKIVERSMVSTDTGVRNGKSHRGHQRIAGAAVASAQTQDKVIQNKVVIDGGFRFTSMNPSPPTLLEGNPLAEMKSAPAPIRPISTER